MNNADNSSSTPPISRCVAAFAADLSLADIPPDVVERARYLMLDTVGCALAARGEAFASIYAKAIAELSGSLPPGAGRAVIGYEFALPMRDAALLNGVLAHGLDFDDTHIAGIAHLSVAVLPAVIALAAQRSLPGARALLAYLVGLEAGSRLAAAAPGLFHDSGFHPTVTVGVFASAIACATLIGLDTEGIERAQGFALSMAGGTLQFVEDGAWTKRLHAGWAASAGITCAVMANYPIPTPIYVYEGRFGLLRAFLGDERMCKVDLGGIISDLGMTWQLMGIGVKPFPVCHFNHACADAAILLHERLAQTGIGIHRIRRIEARVPEGVMPSVCVPVDTKRTPTTDYEAKFSLPYAVASGLLRGHLGLTDLLPEAISDPKVRAIMQRIDCLPDPVSTFPQHYTGEIVLTLDDGTTLAHREAVNRGHPERPIEASGIRAKYQANAACWFGAEDIRVLEDFVLTIDSQPDMRALEPLLTPAPVLSFQNQGVPNP
jgi:2-methylcitrate dehydratase PrpD